MSQTTPNLNPKYMLSAVVRDFMYAYIPLLQHAAADKKAVFAFRNMVKGMDVQLVSFREFMFILKEDQKIDYWTAVKEIKKQLIQKENMVHEKDTSGYMDALYDWCELLASAYPALGLVPEPNYDPGGPEAHPIDGATPSPDSQPEG